jgi:transposase
MMDVAKDACPCCGGVLHSIGESVSEMLDWVPAQLRVVRITYEPRATCRVVSALARIACGLLTYAYRPETTAT